MVSIIIPCYNAENYIERCLNSVLNQTDRDIELILVNDGSTDKSDIIIQQKKVELEAALSRFIYIKQENGGVGAACNVGFKYVSGEFLLLLDTDDVLQPESVQEQKEWLQEHTEYSIVRTNGYYVDENDFSIKSVLEVEPDRRKHHLLFEELFDGITYVWPGSYMIRMKTLEEIYPDREIYPSRSGQNLQFLMMAAYFGKDGFIDKMLMMYTVRAESLSHFTGEDVLNKEVNAMLGYKDIRKHLIDEHIEDEEKKYWNWRLELLYAKEFVRIGIKHKNKKIAKDNYFLVKQLSKNKRDWNFVIEYYRWVNPIIYFFLRLCRKLRVIKA